MRKLLFLSGLFILVMTSVSSGQSTLPCSTACSLLKSQPFAVAYNWAPTALNPELADGFSLYQNGVKIRDVSISGLVNGVIAFDFSSGLATAGNYSFNVSAYTSGGETFGDPISITILKGKPAKPTGGRFQ